MLQREWLPKIELRGAGSFSSDPAELALVNQLKGHKGQVARIAFADNGRQLISTGADATIRIWDTMTGQNNSHDRIG